MCYDVSIMNIFLDLEETVINAWDKNPIFLSHCKRIFNLLRLLKVESVQIFSFAIHTPEEEEEFKIFIQSDLEKRIGVPVSKVIPVRDMFTASQKVQKMHFEDLCDFILTRGKEGAFHDWCNMNHQKETSILIDDVVPNRTTIDHDFMTNIQTVNVTSLEKDWNRNGRF